MSDEEREHYNRARARSALSIKLLGITSKGLSEITSFVSNAAKYASDGEDNFDDSALIDPLPDYDTIDLIADLEDKGVKIPYEELVKMDREDIKDAVHNAYMEYEEKFPYKEEADDWDEE